MPRSKNFVLQKYKILHYNKIAFFEKIKSCLLNNLQT